MTNKFKGLKEAFIPAILIVVVPTTILGFLLSGSGNLLLLIEGIYLIILVDILANVINNYSDWQIDIRNKKRMAMHKAFSRQQLLWIYVALLLIIYISMFIFSSNIYLIAVVTIFVLLGILYSAGTKLKDKAFVNYLTIAIAYAGVSSAIGFFSGSSSIALFARWLPLILFLMLVDLGYSMTKDYSDILGDKEHGKRTLPVVFGKGRAVKIQLTFVTVAYAFLIVMVAAGILNPAFLVLLVSYLFALYILNAVNKTTDRRIEERMHFNSQRNGLFVRALIIVLLLLLM